MTRSLSLATRRYSMKARRIWIFTIFYRTLLQKQEYMLPDK